MKTAHGKGFLGVLWALLLALELAVTVDCAAAGLGRPLPLTGLAVGAGVLFLLLALLPIKRQNLRFDALALLIAWLVAALLSIGFLAYYAGQGALAETDQGKGALYAGHTVLVAVNEPGEENALAGGVMEAYRHYGSAVWIYTLSGESLREYGGAEVPETPDGALARVRPDVILCPRGGDAKPLLEAADRAGGENRPLVLQGLSSLPAQDVYSANLHAVPGPTEGVSASRWASRLRLPVSTAGLSRSLLGMSGGLASLPDGGERRALLREGLSGERVFWPRGGTEAGLSFVKITNAAGDFVYDYFIDPRGRESFELYTSGAAAEQALLVSCEGERCSARLSGGTLEVICPKGRRCIVTVTSADGSFWDTVLIANPGRFLRETAPALENALLRFWDERLPSSCTWALVNRLLQK